MLRDAEVVQLRSERDFKKAVAAGLQQVVRDLISSGGGDLKPEVAAFLKIVYAFTKARLIRQELSLSTVGLLERLMNFELKWPRTPAAVRAICESDQTFLWMRYDIQRTEALFARARFLLSDAAFRAVVKRHSSITGDKNERLQELLAELDILASATRRSLATKGLYDELIKYQSEEFYKSHEDAIQAKFLDASTRGALGMLPPAERDDSADGGET